jgi:hypothetical protein
LAGAISRLLLGGKLFGGNISKIHLAGKFQKHLGGNNFKIKGREHFGRNILAGNLFFFTFKTLQNAPFLNKGSET